MAKEIESGGVRIKKRQKMEERRTTMAEVFGGESFAKYFMHFARENCKRQMCPFALEKLPKNCGKIESDIRERTISTSSRDSI